MTETRRWKNVVIFIQTTSDSCCKYGQVLLLSKICTCNLEKHNFKERIHTANKLKVAGQSVHLKDVDLDTDQLLF